MKTRNRRLLIALVVLASGSGATGRGVALANAKNPVVAKATGPEASLFVTHTLSSGLFNVSKPLYGTQPDVYYSITNLSNSSHSYTLQFLDESGQPAQGYTLRATTTVTIPARHSYARYLEGTLDFSAVNDLRLVVTERTPSGVATSAKPFVEVTYYQPSAEYVPDGNTDDNPKDTPVCCLTAAIVPLEDFTDTVTPAPAPINHA